MGHWRELGTLPLSARDLKRDEGRERVGHCGVQAPPHHHPVTHPGRHCSAQHKSAYSRAGGETFAQVNHATGSRVATASGPEPLVQRGRQREQVKRAACGSGPRAREDEETHAKDGQTSKGDETPPGGEWPTSKGDPAQGQADAVGSARRPICWGRRARCPSHKSQEGGSTTGR